jgi:HD-GYP domain-containing protein (c-di-GMP phosphodiesterase class II)
MACVAFGLWWQYQYIASSVRQSVAETVWRDLENEGHSVLFSPRDPEPIATGSVGTLPDQIVQETSSVHLSCEDTITLVDAEWRVLASRPGDVHGSAPSLSPGTALSWKKNSAVSDAQRVPLRGVLDLPEGRHLAVAYGRQNQPGHILIHRPADSVKVPPSVLLKPLPADILVTFVWLVSLLSVILYMVLVPYHERLIRQWTQKEKESLKRTRAFARTRDAIVFGLAKLAESRSRETGEHLERIALYCQILSDALRRRPDFSQTITPAFTTLIQVGSALHDIGKVGLPDSILLKRGELTPDERRLMQNHTTFGGECLAKIEYRLGSSNFLKMARQIALYHHERWDGSGYPAGLSGTAIPLAARIVALADVYDALSSPRAYKETYPHEQCVDIIRQERGKHFDPRIVDAFLEHESKFSAVARLFGIAVPLGFDDGEDVADSKGHFARAQPAPA